MAWSDSGGEYPPMEFSGEARQGDPFSLIADVGLAEAAGIKSKIGVNQGVKEYVQWFKSTL
jgi:UDP-glucose 4-epimerase